MTRVLLNFAKQNGTRKRGEGRQDSWKFRTVIARDYNSQRFERRRVPSFRLAGANVQFSTVYRVNDQFNLARLGDFSNVARLPSRNLEANRSRFRGDSRNVISEVRGISGSTLVGISLSVAFRRSSNVISEIRSILDLEFIEILRQRDCRAWNVTPRIEIRTLQRRSLLKRDRNV